jgi:hypothetical protein
MIENYQKKSVCQLCGKEFSCGAETGECWCFEINTDSEFLAELSENYKNCLCRECLVQRAKNFSEPKSTIAENGK